MEAVEEVLELPRGTVTPHGQLGLRKIMAALPVGWRTTVFPGRVILYKEDKRYRYETESFTA